MLVTGGSQGARVLSEVVPDGLAMLAAGAALAAAGDPAVPRRGSRRGAPALRQPRHRGRARHLLRGHARAARRRAPVHRPRRRFDDRRADRGRPSGDPRAAADRHRRPPGRQRARDRQGRRRALDPPAQLHRQGARQADQRAGAASRDAGHRGARGVELRPAQRGARPCRPRRELRRRADPGRDPHRERSRGQASARAGQRLAMEDAA